MKKLFEYALAGACLVLSMSRGGPHPDFIPMQKARATARELFRAGNPAAAVSSLRTSTRAEPVPGGQEITLIQRLMEIAAECYNRRDLALARTVANEAFALAAPLLVANDQATRGRRSEMAGSLGILKEDLFNDFKAAEAYYRVAVQIDPGNRQGALRQNVAIERQKAKRRSGGS